MARKTFKRSGVYQGPVGFGSDGYHYPIGMDGHLDQRQPLIVQIQNGVETYVWAPNAEAPTHAHTYEQRVVEVQPGGGS